jgi:methyl-accepting chemotaxis protein
VKNWSIKSKLILLCSSLVVVILLVGGIEYYGSKKLSAQIEDFNTNQLPAVRNMGLADMMHDGMRAIAYRAIYVSGGDDLEQKKEIAEELKEASENMNKYISEIDKLDIKPATKVAIDDAKPEIEKYLKSAEKIVGLALSGQKEKIDSQLIDFDKAFRSLEVKLETLGDLIEKDVEASQKSEERDSQLIEKINIGVIFFGLIWAIFISLLIGRDLIATLSSIISQLKHTTLEVSQAAEQSASTASSLSEGTTEQASSLQETMASAEEISAMVSQNAESASKAKAAVDTNQKVSEDGSKSVDEMMNAIGEIKQTNDEILKQMETSNKEFAEIVKIISEIGTKTNVINEIVFQTKLLSFNASVEAARAGEHGKGFAVVAEEVGNLAQMSGNAAKEITDMLSDSIKKVNAIVEHTKDQVDHIIEVGKDKITMGQSTAQKCKQALNEITENARSMTTMISEITNASKEQAQGVQEINKAISQLDQVTQQNSSVAQQSATQADHLNSEAHSLSNAVVQLVQFLEGVQSGNSHTEENHIDENHGSGQVVSLSPKRKAQKPSTDGTHSSMKKAVGSSSVPSANDPHFEEF